VGRAGPRHLYADGHARAALDDLGAVPRRGGRGRASWRAFPRPSATHATLLLKAGTPPHVVSQRLGHSTVAFTLQVYAHVLPGQQRQAADAIEATLLPNAQTF